MNYREAFNRTLGEFEITGKSLSIVTGVQERQISNFRNGKSELTTESFFSLVQAMPLEAQHYFFATLAGQAISVSSLIAAMPAEELIDSLPKEQIKNLLLAVANYVSKSSTTSLVSSSSA